MKQAGFFCSLLLVFLLGACSHDALDVDTSGVDVAIDYRNLDSLIVHTEKDRLQAAILEWRVDIPEIIDYELGYCLGAGMVTDTGMVNAVDRFRKDAYIVRVEKRIAEKFPDLSANEAVITEGFRHLKAHLPDVKLPKHIVFMNSFYASSAFCTENDLAIGLERYLGEKTDVIRELPSREYPEWIKKAFAPEYLERDALTAWIMTHVLPEQEGTNNISQIIRWGKILYLTEAAFPEMEKHLIMRYSALDYQWAMDNERDFWQYLVDQKLLFETSEKVQSNLLREAPFTAGLPEKGPDRLGQFLGWRIVQSYMEQYDITVAELLKLPYTELLSEYEIE